MHPHARTLLLYSLSIFVLIWNGFIDAFLLGFVHCYVVVAFEARIPYWQFVLLISFVSFWVISSRVCVRVRVCVNRYCVCVSLLHSLSRLVFSSSKFVDIFVLIIFYEPIDGRIRCPIWISYSNLLDNYFAPIEFAMILILFFRLLYQ